MVTAQAAPWPQALVPRWGPLGVGGLGRPPLSTPLGPGLIGRPSCWKPMAVADAGAYGGFVDRHMAGCLVVYA
jgi:hypothetical protein